jgi:hypothetical protein
MKPEYSWNIEGGSPFIQIMYNGEEVMNIFIGEAIEIAGREVVMKHIQEIERTPWIRNWHYDRSDI